MGAAALGAAPRRPNIILMMADDMGFSDLGCYGSEIPTPNLDRLAAGGVRFTQFYNTARCCPTRAALLTGLYRTRPAWATWFSDRGTPAYQGYLNDRCVTIAEALKPGGYHTLMSGKWHVGEDRPHWPVDRGFEHYFGLISGGSNYWRLDKGRQWPAITNRISPIRAKFYMTDAFTDNAVDSSPSTAPNRSPFFLYLAFTSPHWPLHAWPEDIAKYRGKYKMGWDALRSERHERQIEMGIVDPNWPLTPRDSAGAGLGCRRKQDDLDLRMAVYAAQIDRMDQNIGRIIAKLRELGVEQNTLVMFLSDNGGCAEEIDPRQDRRAARPPRIRSPATGVPWANASNTPFRLYKHWVHEGGIATPLIVHWPAVIKSGRITHQVGHIIDLMATCLDAGGTAVPGKRRHAARGQEPGAHLRRANSGSGTRRCSGSTRATGRCGRATGSWSRGTRIDGNCTTSSRIAPNCTI